ncbi:phosphatidic acid phosphatase [Trypanosoma theileri]|uniref:Phosphatidic acid phosphatase n=1 Tax=Trypanosoma theileri TaxID=67003 RepID=A0A1X0P729_9TRYP|nr:phosphatidic acid phosphatase [Trypanosoma theileri]ORC92631.1 phosphatidic acid phosphatase [Trypanosoma theileri]
MSIVWEWRILDYATCIVLGFVGWLVGSYVWPHCRQFSFDDSSIKYDRHEGETFPTYSVIIAIALILFVYVAGEYYTWRRHSRRILLRYLNAWVLAHAFSICLEFCIVNLSKLYAGRLRPDFLQRMADEGITIATIGGFTETQVCHAAREGRLSFPSGHSGTAFAGFVPLSLYLLGLTRALQGGAFYRAILAVLPLCFPIITAISRTRDNYHHFADIVAGSLIGSACGIFSVLLSFVPTRSGRWALREPESTNEERSNSPRCDTEEQERELVNTLSPNCRRETDLPV